MEVDPTPRVSSEWKDAPQATIKQIMTSGKPRVGGVVQGEEEAGPAPSALPAPVLAGRPAPAHYQPQPQPRQPILPASRFRHASSPGEGVTECL